MSRKNKSKAETDRYFSDSDIERQREEAQAAALASERPGPLNETNDEIARSIRDEVAAEQQEAPRESDDPDWPCADEKENAVRFGPAGMLTCALAMVGLWHDGNLETDVRAVADCLALFFEADPQAPPAAGLMQIKLTLKVLFLPNEDQRRVELAITLFKAAYTGMVTMARADAKAEFDRLAAAGLTAAQRPRDKDGPFDKDEGRFEPSDLGHSVAKQG